MYDLRKTKIINLDNSKCLKENTTYKFQDTVTNQDLIAKFIAYYDDPEDEYLIYEFRKLALLSGEPEIATVYFIATGQIGQKKQSCYIMDFIHGSTLKKYLDQRKSIIYEVAINILVEITSGIEKAHHYDIFHSDLHDENIMINQFGFVKIIDFSWMNKSQPRKMKFNKDLEDFKLISNRLLEKCSSKEKSRFKLINDYCQNVNTFNGLKKEILMLDEISFEISLLERKHLRLLSKLFEDTKNLFQLNFTLGETKFPIPIKFIIKITTGEERYLDDNRKNKGNPRKLQYSDSRKDRIKQNLENIFNEKLHALKQSNLLDWKIWITNDGENFVGPYQLNYNIVFTSKFFKWKKINELIPFTEKVDLNFEKLILED